SIEAADDDATVRTYEYYDPIDTLPAEGQAWWSEHGMESVERTLADAAAAAAASRLASEGASHG
ncbi:MAG TPA: hypothetical protein VEV13_03615, partial [Candidatus Limnocylindria bacterium]|nr:hypothetical protein [Candidatus Limnocylindria bacterium]